MQFRTVQQLSKTPVIKAKHGVMIQKICATKINTYFRNCAGIPLNYLAAFHVSARNRPTSQSKTNFKKSSAKFIAAMQWKPFNLGRILYQLSKVFYIPVGLTMI